jgi:hypothetical protein
MDDNSTALVVIADGRQSVCCENRLEEERIAILVKVTSSTMENPLFATRIPFHR